MLVLSRQRDESIIIGDNVQITVVDIRGDKVRLLIEISDGPRKLLTTTLGLRRGGMVLVGGPSHKAGVLILIISAE